MSAFGRQTARLLPLACLILAGPFAWAQDTPELDHPPTLIPPRQAPVDEDALMTLADEPQVHMDRARESFLAKNINGAANEIRKAAAFVRLQAAVATDVGKAGLDRSAAELKSLADAVQNGAVDSVATLDRTFSRVNYSLSQHHYLKALECRTRHALTQAGQQFRIATCYVDRGVRRAGFELREGGRAVLENTRQFGGRIVEGAGDVTDGLGDGLNKLGQRIQQLGQRLYPERQ